ncbi:hypothetical protein ACJX0J_025538 [Zea mays]
MNTKIHSITTQWMRTYVTLKAIFGLLVPKTGPINEYSKIVPKGKFAYDEAYIFAQMTGDGVHLLAFLEYVWLPDPKKHRQEENQEQGKQSSNKVLGIDQSITHRASHHLAFCCPIGSSTKNITAELITKNITAELVTKNITADVFRWKILRIEPKNITEKLVGKELVYTENLFQADFLPTSIEMVLTEREKLFLFGKL